MSFQRQPSAAIVALLFALSGLNHALAEPPRVIEHAEFGFRISVPEGWMESLEARTVDALLQLVLRPPGQGADGQFSLWVLEPVDSLDPFEYRRHIVLLLQSQPSYGEVRLSNRKWGATEVPVLDFSHHAPGGPALRARQVVVTAGGFRYVFQYYAPVGRIEALRPAFEAVIDGFQELPLSVAGRDGRRMRERAARCGSEMGWSPNWDAAATRARAEGKLVLAYVHAYAGFHITDMAMRGAFMDADVLELVHERYIPVRISAAVSTPLHAPEQYGLSPTTFGQALLVVTPDGKVLREGACFEPAAVCELLRLPEDARPESAAASNLERIRRRIERGDLVGADTLLGKESTPEAHQLRASLRRRERQADAALAELALARAAGRSDLTPQLDLEEGRILLGCGRYEPAYLVFARLIQSDPNALAAREAAYWMGALLLLGGHKDQAETCWRTLATGDIEDRWANKAAGMLLSTGFSFGIGERLDWPRESLLASMRWRRREAGDVGGAEPAAAEALAWLLKNQRDNGAWSSPSEAPRPGEGLSDFAESITALAVRALGRSTATPEITSAMERGVDWLLTQHALRRTRPQPVFFMDYAVWRHACVLECLSERIESGAAQGSAILVAASEIVSALAATQKPNGGWSYFQSTRLQPEKPAPSLQSISFVTAAVTLALVRAQAAGVPLAPGMLDRALGALERMRNADGTFAYFLDIGGAEAAAGDGGPGAAGRSPACALALLRGNRESTARLRTSLDVYRKHRAALAKEGGKALMHTGPEGQGSHYLLFDYFHAAEAVAELPEVQRGEFRDAIVEDVMRLREVDGSFLDTPVNGRDYGAAMVLGVLLKLHTDGETRAPTGR